MSLILTEIQHYLVNSSFTRSGFRVFNSSEEMDANHTCEFEFGTADRTHLQQHLDLKFAVEFFKMQVYLYNHWGGATFLLII